LSRNTAAELISQHFASTPAAEARIAFFLPGIPTPDKLSANTGGLGVLHRLGYVDCEIMPERDIYTDGGMLLQHIPPTCKLVLTANGLKASASWKVDRRDGESIESVSIPVAKPELVEITGITEKDNEATATYTWRQKPINDIGEAMGYGKVEQGAMQFRKFDDGWRVVR